MKPIAVYARDPGAANQMIAVCEKLRAVPADPRLQPLLRLFALGPLDVPELRVHAKGAALGMFANAGLAPAADTVPDAVLLGASALLSGLDDVDDSTPRALWRGARNAGIPSAAFCDNDVNLSVRLMDRGARVAPDMIFATSERGRQELAGCSIPRLDIQVIPDLHLERLAANRPASGARDRLRQAWGVPADATVWLYAGVIRREFANLREVGPEDEVESLRALLAALSHRHLHAVVIVRPHPRDPAGKYDGVCASTGVFAQVNMAGTPPEAFLAADFIISLSEAVRNEARILGCRALAPAEALSVIERGQE